MKSKMSQKKQNCIFLFLTFFGFGTLQPNKYTVVKDGVCMEDQCTGNIYPPESIYYPPESIHSFIPDKMGFDEIYVINLKRRVEKRRIMEETFKKLRLNVTFWDGVDGREIDQKYLDDIGIKMMPKYLDPYHQRPMKYGEIGCFLSHFYIWTDIVDKEYDKVLILEDDATFEPMFRRQWSRMFADVQEFIPNWDLVYLGRKALKVDSEREVDGSSFLIWPHYSYWTVAYALSNIGARKLLSQKPLHKMVPVDEYLPIMFDRNPNGVDSWNKYFHPRNLVAVSLKPTLIKPSFGIDVDYVTDTEDTAILQLDEN